MSTPPNIYWHLGTERTGTKFLQQSVFPKFKDIGYINRGQFHEAAEIISRAEHTTYLVSYELNLDGTLENAVKDFARQFPHAVPVVVFRPQADWLASQYRRHLKNGMPLPFSAMFEPRYNSGKYKAANLYYSHIISILVKYFAQPPMVLLYDDLLEDPEGFISQLAELTGAGLDMNELDLARRHSSYTDAQLKALLAISSRINILKYKDFNNRPANLLHGWWKDSLRYTALALANILPPNGQSLISPKELEAVQQFFAADWQQVLASPYLSSYANRPERDTTTPAADTRHAGTRPENS